MNRYFGYFTIREWIAMIACHVIVYAGFAGAVLVLAYWHGWRPW